MNAKHCKALRAATLGLLGKDWREHKYQGKWVASRRYTVTDAEGTVHKQALQIRLHPTCGRAAYHEAKLHVSARRG
jgi:hypothetical protein